MLTLLGPSHILTIPIMQLNYYLIFILVLVVEAIGLGFTATNLDAFKLSNFLGYKFLGSRPHSCTLPSFSFIIYIQIPTILTLLSPSTLLPPPYHNWDPTQLSILDISHPSPHSSSPPPQNHSPPA